ncbi:furin-like protease kpc-1 isoform X5 [Crassostrea angulata]|uniref:furin-like protease kpc-1 isoform X5 n=1 Tax=Magallana angulata TaxID=2784310 RepID=UPI0005C3939E|nr:furin-like protease kpc-1 isoform X12 [Crassostrea gigas]XP_052698698.1 furin-like protease kpc-1 isoform X5 [Crassostrea angulata]|eukprot:XP_011453981.1 PREDICTED: furin-1 isoform X4 [Crassostrea gigas]
MRLHGRFIIQISILGFVLIDYVRSNKYTNTWALHIEGGEAVARSLARKHGFIYVDQIMPDYYAFQHRKVAKRSIYPSSYHHRSIVQEANVKWLEQQVVKKRVKRDRYYTSSQNFNRNFNDPKWKDMWYLHGEDLKKRGSGLDMNVMGAWEQGVTGKRVVVTILDDGIEKDHPDLMDNYDPDASFDVNSHDKDPQPHYDYTNENRHGTRCAGEVAAKANNNVCGVGVAYNARIGGVRMLDGDVTDSVEAQSLSLRNNHIDIYSASWGPDDDGRTVDGPATLARKAFYDGITKGRGGRGSIFVWASGNGGRDGDSCNCDGYTNSIYTLSISSATENGNIPWYSEACSSTLATTYSSGSGGERQIVTTDLRKICTVNHTGTSASAPLAAGICALALEANPTLTWRDMQHIVVNTARKANLDPRVWTTNGVGRQVSHSFGFGLMDAGAMVRLARNWTSVPPQHICEIAGSQERNKPIPMNGKLVITLDTDGCKGTPNYVRYLEHVQARITLTADRRGEVVIYLTSPSNTRSTLLARRERDYSREGFNNWAFMTTHNWGEEAEGRWFLQIENGASSFSNAEMRDWVLVLYGTETNPQDMPTTPTTTTTISRNNPKKRHEDAEIKDWRLTMYGTEKHPQSQNVSQPVYRKHVNKCPEGTCFECKVGFYKHKDECVATCPEQFYGDIETVVSRRNSSRKTKKEPIFFRQGACNPCNEACNTCKGPDLEDCFQCNKGYELRDNLCRKKLIMNFLDPDMLSFFVWVIILCTSAILLFGVIFIILQARDHRILCWKEKRHLDEGKGKYNGVKSVSEGKKERDHLNVVVRNVHYRHDDNDFMLNRPLPPLPVSHHAVSHHTRHYHPFRT